MSKRINIEHVKSVCLTLGPYRNLTTLTASILSLHPNCQVLNHAGYRILNDKSLNFLDDYDNQKFDSFLKFAISASKGGLQGNFGGSINLSHAFDHTEMRETYRARYGDSLVKETIKCVFWKESLIVTNFIKHNNIPLSEILIQNEKIKFLMPIRNPLDCALSNIKTGHIGYFDGLSAQPKMIDVVDRILAEILWFCEYKMKHPNQFFFLPENRVNNKTFEGLAHFLKLVPEYQWINDSIKLFKIMKKYKHNPYLLDYYSYLVESKFKFFPTISQLLIEFTYE